MRTAGRGSSRGAIHPEMLRWQAERVQSDDLSPDSWVAMVSAIYCPKRPAQRRAGTLCSSQDFQQGPRRGGLSSHWYFSFSFRTSVELSPGFAPIFHSPQIFALPPILLTCPAFVFPSISNTLKYPLDKAFPLRFHLLQLLFTTCCLSKGIQFN